MALVESATGLTPAQCNYRFPMNIPIPENGSYESEQTSLDSSSSYRNRKSSWTSISSEQNFLPSPPKSRKGSTCSVLSEHSAFFCRSRRRSSFSTLSHIDEEATLVEVHSAPDFRTCPQLVFSQPKLLGGSQTKKEKTSTQAPGNEVLTTLVLEVNPKTHHVSEVFQLSDKKLLVIIENFLTNCTDIYHESIRNISFAIANNAPKLTFNKFYEHCALDESKQLIALYNILGGELVIVSYKFAKENVYSKQIYDMLPHFGQHPLKIRKLLFVLGTNDLIFVETPSTYQAFDLLTNRLR
ncbi:hypothetical protein K493DRAFT_321752 [Basidiobolus meristosporus CBS 931.73]|uniref:Uncharacterized protein n=1 Tax=Basidiobolus meristosporus CBS 931.73 TaxID=1314790 RepID=A0A1Y1WJ26_9FUNG|nr:hypothetical protein K493DRAFT_321752 [Basidiobolus meristosporus CBS 931.73]|eukprot:ORX73493.1 hypothetical protein K493DRAFT_321752 [Basidiobolus meristosporus CBS 931.73]